MLSYRKSSSECFKEGSIDRIKSFYIPSTHYITWHNTSFKVDGRPSYGFLGKEGRNGKGCLRDFLSMYFIQYEKEREEKREE